MNPIAILSPSLLVPSLVLNRTWLAPKPSCQRGNGDQRRPQHSRRPLGATTVQVSTVFAIIARYLFPMDQRE
jgi:hypothetical protein